MNIYIGFDSSNYGIHTTGQSYIHLETMPAELNKDQVMDTNKTDLNKTDHGFITFNPDATICQKKAWADHHKIRWDGITNYNNC